MRLTNFLFRRNRVPHGNIFRGKDRYVKIVTPLYIARLKNGYEIEEQNMLYLRHPYLTAEQNAGHGRALGHHDQFIQKWKDFRATKFKKDLTIEERLLHLKVGEKWE